MIKQLTIMLKPPAAGADIHLQQLLASQLPNLWTRVTVRTNSVQGRCASLVVTGEGTEVTDADMDAIIGAVNNITAPFQFECSIENIETAAPAPPAPRAAPAPPSEPEEESDGEDEGEDDLASLSKPELQEIAKEMGLPTSGNKPDIVERIREAEAQGDESAQDEGGEDENPDDVTIEE